MENYKFILSAIVATIMGASVRIAFVKDNEVVSKRFVFKNYLAAFFCSWLVYLTFKSFHPDIITAACLALGAFSVELVSILIDRGPQTVWNKIKMVFNLKEDKDVTN